MIKTNDFKTLFVVFVISITYTQCATLKTAPNRTSSHRTEVPRKVNRESTLRKDIVRYAKKQLGAKYKYAGKNPSGFDCSGFTMYVMKKFDIALSGGSSAQEGNGQKIAIKDTKAGDLIFFRRTKKGRVFHVAMVISHDREGIQVIHSTSRGVVIDNISQSSYWNPKISTARRVITKRS